MCLIQVLLDSANLGLEHLLDEVFGVRGIVCGTKGDFGGDVQRWDVHGMLAIDEDAQKVTRLGKRKVPSPGSKTS